MCVLYIIHEGIRSLTDLHNELLIRYRRQSSFNLDNNSIVKTFNPIIAVQSKIQIDLWFANHKVELINQNVFSYNYLQCK